MEAELCVHLRAIRDNELVMGNEIARVDEGTFTNCDLFVSLRRAFSAEYEEYIDAESVSVTVNTDAHYPIGKSYYCGQHRHALFAPQQMRR